MHELLCVLKIGKEIWTHLWQVMTMILIMYIQYINSSKVFKNNVNTLTSFKNESTSMSWKYFTLFL